MSTIGIVALMRNEATNLAELAPFFDAFDEVVIVNDNSTDTTVEVAERCGYRVIDVDESDSFAAKRTRGIETSTCDWILMVDADERPLPGFVESMRQLVEEPGVVGYECRFRSYFAGHWLRYGGRYPLWVLRLIRRDAFTGFVGDIHERAAMVGGAVRKCDLEFDHFSYSSTDHYLKKINGYTAREADELRGARVTWLPPLRAMTKSLFRAIRHAHASESTFSSAIRDAGKQEFKNRYVVRLALPFYPLSRFFYLFVVRRGFLDRAPGLRFALLSACYSVLKYIKFFERGQVRDS